MRSLYRGKRSSLAEMCSEDTRRTIGLVRRECDLALRGDRYAFRMFRLVREPIISRGNREHEVLACRIRHPLRLRPGLLGALAPGLGGE